MGPPTSSGRPFASGRNAAYFIAEVGGNHEGDFQRALRLADLAIESGADAVKFQIYTGDSLVSRIENPSRNEHFKKFELSRDQYEQLARRCHDSDVAFMASIWSLEQLTWANDLVPIHKVGSGDLTAYPILRALAQTGKPIILSTGLATFEEVQRTVKFIRDENTVYESPEMLALLQCTSCYPTDDQEINLSVMQTYRALDTTVGFSDHSVGDTALMGAVALGADILEKHFTESREGSTFRDHLISLTRDEIAAFLKEAHRLRSMLGSSEKTTTAGERETGHVVSFRRSVYAAKDLPSGHVLRERDLVVLRPDLGVSATHYAQLVGKRLCGDIAEHALIRPEDLVEP